MLEGGRVPHAITACEAFLEMVYKEKTKLEQIYVIKEVGPTIEYVTLVEKVNEIIRDRNTKRR